MGARATTPPTKVQLAYGAEQDGTKKDALLDEAETFRDDAQRLYGKDNDEDIRAQRHDSAGPPRCRPPQKRYMKYGKIFDSEPRKGKGAEPR